MARLAWKNDKIGVVDATSDAAVIKE